MATVTSSGSVSGINVSSLVSQLVAADRAVDDNRNTKVDTALTTEFTALSKLKGAMSTFQTALSSLKAPSDFQLRKTTVSDKDAFDATAGANAAAGTYDVEIVKLAKASQLASQPFLTGSTAVVGSGTLQISMGASTFSVDVTAEKNTLADVRDAINNASGNSGVRATLIKAQDGTRLVLTGSATGEAPAVKVTTTGGDGGLAQIVYDPPTTQNMNVVTAAQDAEVKVSGYTIKSASNTVSDAIDGVSLTLKEAEEDKIMTLTIANDDSGVQAKVQNFVNAYNALAKVMVDLRSYDATTKAAGPLLGDSMLRGIEQQVRRVISDPVNVAGSSSGYTTLASLGITTNASGVLEMNATKFAAAMKADPSAASRIFTSSNGVTTRMDATLTAHLAKDGDLAARDAGITSRRKQLDADKTALDARMEVIEARYTKTFSALDSMLTQMQSTSTYLSQQLSKSVS